MVNDPERPIEKLLRGYARRRRGDAGESAEIHPVNRRLLQSEVERVYGGNRRASHGFRLLWIKRWPILAWGTGGLGLVVLLVLFWWPASPVKEESYQMAKREVDGPRAVLAQNSKAPDKTASEGQDASSLMVAGRSGQESLRMDLAARQSEPPKVSLRDADAVRPAPPKDAPSPALGAPGGTGLLAASRPPVPETWFVAQSPAAIEPDSLSTSRRLAPAASGALRSKSAQLAASPSILASFRVEQSGEEIRIVDSDGSQYRGSLALAQQDLARTGVGGVAISSSVASASGESIRNSPLKTSASPPNAPSSVQNYSFRVTGTNLSLKQQIVFSGQFMPRLGTAAATPTQSLPGNVSRSFAIPPPPETLSLPDYQIQGRAIIGSNSEVLINAQPAK